MATGRTCQETDGDEVDLRNKTLVKLDKEMFDEFNYKNVRVLRLDDNELTKLENLALFKDTLLKLSASKNHFPRMYGVASLHNLTTLNLSKNYLVVIEGLKELKQLQWINLSNNNLKIIQNLVSNVKLTYLDVSENNITSLADLSSLVNLETFLLHGNNISSLDNAVKYLPSSLKAFSLAENDITDLNQVSHLSGLQSIRQLSVMNNPCVLMTGQSSIGFDYRPFVINWCFGLELLDGYVIGDKESLKAEWLYSQGKGRRFNIGEHMQLVRYLLSSCPLTSEMFETEEDFRLNRVLRKQKLYRKQLLDELSSSHGGDGDHGSSLLSSSFSKTPPIEVPNRTNPLDSSHIMCRSTGDIETKKKIVGSSDTTQPFWSPKKLIEIDSKSAVESDIKLEDINDGEMSKSLDSQSSFLSPRIHKSSSTARPKSATLSENVVVHGRKNVSSGLADSPLVFSGRAIRIKKTYGRSVSASPRISSISDVKSGLLRNLPYQRTTSNDISQTTNGISSKSSQIGRIPRREIINKAAKQANDKFIGDNGKVKTNLGSTFTVKDSNQIHRKIIQPNNRQSIKSTTVIRKYDDEDINSIVKVQALWRGHWIRNYCPKTTRMIQHLCIERMHKKMCITDKYIQRLIAQMNQEQKLRTIQSNVIKSLWDEVKRLNQKVDSLSLAMSTKENSGTPIDSGFSSFDVKTPSKSKCDNLATESQLGVCDDKPNDCGDSKSVSKTYHSIPADESVNSTVSTCKKTNKIDDKLHVSFEEHLEIRIDQDKSLKQTEEEIGNQSAADDVNLNIDEASKIAKNPKCRIVAGILGLNVDSLELSANVNNDATELECNQENWNVAVAESFRDVGDGSKHDQQSNLEDAITVDVDEGNCGVKNASRCERTEKSVSSDDDSVD